MADILIRGMEMPEEGKPVAIIIRSDGEVWLIDWDNTVYTGYVACWPTTPLKAVPIPEGHGRLGDLDSLYQALIAHEFTMNAGDMLEVIANAETIVPAEGGNADGN